MSLIYNSPQDLSVDNRMPRRAIVVGSCAIGSLNEYVARTYAVECDFFNVNHGCFLPPEPPQPVGDYDFQIIQIPIRIIVPEARLMRLSYDDVEGYQSLFEDARNSLEFCIVNSLRWATEHGLPAFVTNFLTPQQNPIGRFGPRYDLRNMVFFIESLNLELSRILERCDNAFFLDADRISSIYGKKYHQDDSVAIFSHGALISNYDDMHDEDRLARPPQTIAASVSADVPQSLLAICGEAVAMWRTLHQQDCVKLIVLDLDDTLWRGIVAEGQEIDAHTTEGWPIGFVEALLCAKRRGIMLAVASKNDGDRIVEMWPSLYGGRLELGDFAAWKVNWNPKVENVREIIKEINVLPRNVVFIDDNPVERSSISQAFPEIRTLGEDPYILRRIVLWSAEMQVHSISAESTRRTEMVRAQIQRDIDKTRYDAEEFLRALSPTVTIFEVLELGSAKFVRCLELLNKTNQFNTTATKWTTSEIEDAISNGTTVYAFSASDKYTDYGIVGVALIRNDTIAQLVMSCRVFGLRIEHAVVAILSKRICRHGLVTVPFNCTAANAPARKLWPELGFEERDGKYILPSDVDISVPAHVKVIVEI